MAPRRSAPRLTATALACVLALALAGCGRSPQRDREPAQAGPAPTATGASAATAQRGSSGGPGAHTATGPRLPAGAVALAALATTDVTVWSAPGNRDVVALFPANQRAGVPTPFLVRQSREAAGRTWYQVLLPRRPNGSIGWVRGDQVRLVPLSRRVEVDLSARRLELFEGDQLARTYPVAVGRPSAPTPTGRFFITIKLHPPEISSVYGNWALGLSGYSNVLDQFGTGNGQIALHGTSRTSDIGQAVSHGCVRLVNPAISALANALPLGTPVTIKP